MATCKCQYKNDQSFSYLLAISWKNKLGKLLLDYIKNKKVRLRLNVYQKNARALSFYQREGFDIQSEGLDEATGEKEYTMLWQQK